MRQLISSFSQLMDDRLNDKQSEHNNSDEWLTNGDSRAIVEIMKEKIEAMNNTLCGAFTTNNTDGTNISGKHYDNFEKNCIDIANYAAILFDCKQNKIM